MLYSHARAKQLFDGQNHAISRFSRVRNLLEISHFDCVRLICHFKQRLYLLAYPAGYKIKNHDNVNFLALAICDIFSTLTTLSVFPNAWTSTYDCFLTNVGAAIFHIVNSFAFGLLQFNLALIRVVKRKKYRLELAYLLNLFFHGFNVILSRLYLFLQLLYFVIQNKLEFLKLLILLF